MLTRKELKKAFVEGVISAEDYKNRLFEIETLKVPKKPKRHYEAVTEDEFLKIMSVIPSKKVKVACYTAYGSGLRIEEVVNLQKDDIRLKEHKIFVRQGKGSKDRPTNLPKGFKSDWLDLFPLGITKAGIEKSFLAASIKAGVNKVIYTYTTKAGKTRNKYRLHFHCLRHSFATRAIEAGIPINQVQLLMGHSNVSTTSEYITANAKDAIQSIIDKGV